MTPSTSFYITSRTFRYSEAVPFALVCTGLKAYLGNLRCSLQKDDAEFKFKSDDDEGWEEKDEEKVKMKMKMEAEGVLDLQPPPTQPFSHAYAGRE